MANEEHLAQLKRGVAKWNQWRQQQPEIRPDLSLADLSGADLNHANLSHTDFMSTNLIDANLRHTDLIHTNFIDANLSGVKLNNTDLSGAIFGSAKLSKTDLSYAKLGHADFSYADLSGACLDGAFLRSADLSGACLSGASLSSADLSNTNLSDADLSHANLRFVNLSSACLERTIFNQTVFFLTIFAWVDLRFVKGLDTAKHRGPSTVNINSVTLPSHEETRLHFLRGVGFTETQIEYLPSLLTPRPIEYHSLFISYAHQDEAIAKRLYTDLRQHDIPCWFAPHDLQPGQLIFRGIEEAIHLYDKLLLILSHHAITSSWVELEVHSALSKEMKSGQCVLFPLRLDNAVLECEASWVRLLQPRHIADFLSYYCDSYPPAS